MRGAGGWDALSAKVHALYGKRLSREEFDRLAQLKSPEEILQALARHPGWSRALAGCGQGRWSYVGRVEVEAALREELRLEYLSLLPYVPREDRPLMGFRVRLAECTAILNALRRLKVGRWGLGMPPAPRIVLRGKVDLALLEHCESYDQLLEGAKESIYYPALLHLRPGPGEPLPDYTAAEGLLRTAYFTHMHRLAEGCSGRTRQLLLRAMGEQADLLNLLHILRLKTYFPQTPKEEYLKILFPFHWRLKPELIRRLCGAAGPEEVLALLADTPYRDCFQGAEVMDAEEHYRRAQYRFHRRQLLAGPPSVFTAMAYLDLKELEMMLVVNVIESVKYGVPYHASLAQLVGR